METRMEIQGRRRVRHRGGGVRDEVRLASSTNQPEAQDVAQRFAAEGFTVWVFDVRPGAGTAPHYRRIVELSPEDAAGPDRALWAA